MQDIRHSMLPLPKIVQPFLTWLTSKPITGSKPLVKLSGTVHLCTTVIMTLISVLITLICLYKQPGFYVFIPLSIILTVSCFRKLQVVIYHHCSHNTVFHNKALNFLLGEVISIILLLQDFRSYKKNHLNHHNPKKMFTAEDETAVDLAEIGIIPGKKKKQLWLNLLLSFFSPFAHARWLLTRIKMSLFSLDPLHNCISILYWFCLLSIINRLNCWQPFIIAWIIPLTIPYHISRMLRLTVEHQYAKKENIQARQFICESTIAVFNGELFPPATPRKYKTLLCRTKWLSRMILIHLFNRVFVLVGDTPCHDYHHRRPHSREWACSPYARQLDYDSGCPGYPENYQEIWGLFNAIDKNFESMSNI